MEEVAVGDKIAVPPPTVSAGAGSDLNAETIKPLWAPAIDPSTVSMKFLVNDSLLAGEEGKVLTSQKIADWFHAEVENNVSFSIRGNDEDGLEVKERGELHLGILVEKLRREGAELAFILLEFSRKLMRTA